MSARTVGLLNVDGWEDEFNVKDIDTRIRYALLVSNLALCCCAMLSGSVSYALLRLLRYIGVLDLRASII